MARSARFRLLALLYGSQFLGLGFVYYALTAVLRRNGVPLEQIAAVQLLALFWVLKFLWAPLVDRFGSRRLGHYRGWLLALQPLLVVSILALGPLDVTGDLGLIVAVAGVIALVSATQDVAVDATAVRLLEPVERGMGNGVQVAGGYLGFVLGGGGALVVYDRYGWWAAVGALAALTALPLPWLLRLREPARDARPADRVTRAAIRSFFRQPGARRWALVVMPMLWLGIGSAYGLISPMLVDAGWSLERIGAVTVVAGGAVAIGAALAGGAVIARLGRRRALLAFGGVQVAAIVALLPLAAGSAGTGAVLAAVLLLNAGYAVASTAVSTVAMDWSRDGVAGSDFTVQSSFAAFCSHVAGAVSLALAGTLGYPAMVAVSLVLAAGGLAVIARLFADAPAPRREPHLALEGQS